MKKREVLLGQVIPGTKLRALEHLPSDSHGNQRVLVRCEWVVKGRFCDTVKAMRVTDMTRKPYVDRKGKLRLPHRSCGCRSREEHQRFWERRASRIPRRVQRKIYEGHQTYHRSLKALADEFDMELNLASTIFRVYAERLKDRRRIR